jgi:hypothetical protein
MTIETRILELATRRGLLSESAWKQLPVGEGEAELRLKMLEAQGLLSADLAKLLRWEVEHGAHQGPIVMPASWVAESQVDGASPNAASVDLPKLERYRLEQLLGAGAWGLVYRAYDLVLQRDVALKFSRAQSPAHSDRWLREARAQARISHPGVCKVFEVGEAEGRPFISMELIQGHTLGALVGRFELRALVAVLRDAAEAIHAAHRVGLIHLDLKPGNILMEEQPQGGWRPVVADFGLFQNGDDSALGTSSLSKGTPPFSSPEQIEGRKVDRRSDLYALGMTLAVMIAGHLPHTGSDAPLESLLTPAFPVDLQAVLRKAMARLPEDRYDSAQAFAEDLQRFLDGEPVHARDWTLGYHLRTWARRRQSLVRVLGAASLALIATGLFATISVVRARRAAAQAQRFLQWSEELTSLVHRARSAPLHDMRPTYRHLDQNTQAMAKERERLSAEARAAADYAMGRVYESMGQDEAALRCYQSAWDGGYQSPESAMNLGLALGRTYVQRLSSLKAIQDPQRKEAALHRLDESLRLPALRMLGRAREPQSQSAFLQASTAFLEGRYEDTLRAAAELRASQPWDTHVHVLMANAQMALAEAQMAQKHPEEEAKAWDAAEQLLREAIVIDRSDTTLFLHLANHYLRRHNAQNVQWSDAVPWIRAMQDAVDQGLQADPEHAPLLSLRAYMLLKQGYEALTHGQDPEPHFHVAQLAADQALRSNPNEYRALTVKAGVLALASAFRLRAGLPVEPQLLEAAALEERALKLEPDDPYPHTGLMTVCEQLANVAQEKGQDPRPQLERALQEAEQSCKLIPSQAWRQGALVVFAADLVEADLALHQSPETHLAIAFQAAERTQGTADHMPAYLRNRAQLKRLEAQWDLQQGVDPTEAIREAHQWLAKAQAANPTYPETLKEAGELALLEASVPPHRASARYLAEAARAYEKLHHLQPTDLVPLLGLGRVAFEAEALHLANPWIKKGMQALEAIAKKAPQQAEPRLLLGSLYLRAGKPEGEAMRTRALEERPELKFRYEQIQ